MGMLTSQMRLIQIISYRSDLNYNIQLVSTTKLNLSAQINDLIGLGSDLESNSPEMKALEQKKARLQQAEKALDLQLQRMQTQLQAIEAEEQSVKEQLNKSIQRMYAA